jgi:hypothetical protein
MGNPFKDRIQEMITNRDRSECWLYWGALKASGYASVSLRESGTKRTVRAHRLANEIMTGEPFPVDLVADHLCRNKACVNPFHIEPVTVRENTVRGFGPSALNATKTHCLMGHRLDGENLRIKPNKTHGGNVRYCRTCSRTRAREYARRNREQDKQCLHPIPTQLE